MSNRAEAFEHWIRTSFVQMNTELENLYFAKAGLGPPIVLTVAAGYLIALAAVCAALSIFRARSAVTT